MISPAPRHRHHPAALPATHTHEATRVAGARPRPQTIEEAKLALRVAAARRHERARGGNQEGIAGDLASSAIRFMKDHPAALATGVGIVALVVGPGALLKGVATAARLATVAGLIGKATK